MTKFLVVLLISLLFCGRGWGVDEFSGIRCGTEIAKGLIGKRLVNGRVVVTEAAHRDIGLENLGGMEISNRLFLTSWRICGNEYELLLNTKSDIIRDVLPFPSHSRSSPEAIGGCQIDGRGDPDAVIAVLDNRAGYDAMHGSRMLRAVSAWRIDEGHERFEQLSANRIACPLSTIITLDGGP